jgi:hypothetical protein
MPVPTRPRPAALLRRGGLVTGVVAALVLPVALPAQAAPSDPGGDGSTLTVSLELAQSASTRALVARLAAAGPATTATPAAQRRSQLAAAAPPPAVRDTVTTWARAHGLTITNDSPWLVSVAGPDTTLARLLGVPLVHDGTRPDGGTVEHAARRLTVPPALAAAVSSVAGLDNRREWQRRSLHSATPAHQTPAQLRAAADIPAGWTGSGITVGTVQFAQANPQGFQRFATANGISLAAGQITARDVSSTDPNHAFTTSGEGDAEAALDVEAVLSVAPAARQKVYYADPYSALAPTVAAMADDAAAGTLQVASDSWGLCEPESSYNGSADNDQARAALQRLLAAGATFFAASGDDGASDCYSSGASPYVPQDGTAQAFVDVPAAYPETVAVGGTTLTSPETAWVYSGGGQSTLYDRPAYQSGVTFPGTGRLVPDLASDADPSTGLVVYTASTDARGYGGTSLAAPLAAGGLAASLAGQGWGVGAGDIHTRLYTAAAGIADVTTGSNKAYQDQNGQDVGYDVTTGYDPVTGLGTPRWSALAPLVIPDPIVAHYADLGGASSFLGSPVGSEFTVAGGKGQQYTGGTIYYSPTTGARSVHGLILSRYLALGGPAGVLGFPTTDEAATPGANGRFNQFTGNGTGAAVFWSSPTGAWSVRGAILGHYQALGGPAGGLGFPTTDEAGTPDGVGRFNHFTGNGAGASIYWTPGTGAWSVRGAIRARWAALGWETGPLGYPVTDESATPDGVGRFNHFTGNGVGASIYWTPATGAWSVRGAIRAHWAALGWETGPMGYPTSDEQGTPDGVGRFNHFTGGDRSGASIYWTPPTGARSVQGAIRAAWAGQGWETGRLGYPTTDEYAVPGGRRNDFAGGSLTFSYGNGRVTPTYR